MKLPFLLLLPHLAVSVIAQDLLPPDWDPKTAADKVIAGLVKISAPEVRGAHDAEMAIAHGRAFVVYEANEVQPGEAAQWPFVYVAMSVVNLETLAVEKIIPMARGGQVFGDITLPEGACFVPRIIQKDERTLRTYFASESPGKRQSDTWILDFDLETMTFATRLEKAKLKTAAGTFEMQPKVFHEDAVKVQGFTRPPVDFGLYLFDSFKVFDGRTYVAINNYPGGQNALAVANAALDTFEILGHYNLPANLKLTESAVNRLPDGTWMGICRQEGGDRNYMFTTSADGKTWTPGAPLASVPNGDSSKPTFDRIGDVYYLGWQESTRIDGVSRSVFNVDVSPNGKVWARKYRFETENSFQYPTFRPHEGAVYVCVTQGDTDASRKERIMFGKLE